MKETTDVRRNAGRCDVCGSVISMAEGERLTVWDFSDEPDGYVDAVADAVERVAESGEGLDLAETLREDPLIVAHGSCIDHSALARVAEESQLQSE